MFPCEVGIINFNFCHFFVCRETSSRFDDILRFFLINPHCCLVRSIDVKFAPNSNVNY